MALSKLAIGLIAGIGSVATAGGITAGVVISRQNATQNIDSSNDEFNEPNVTNSKEDKSNSSMSSFQPRRDLDVLDSMVSDESKITTNKEDKTDKSKETPTEKNLVRTQEKEAREEIDKQEPSQLDSQSTAASTQQQENGESDKASGEEQSLQSKPEGSKDAMSGGGEDGKAKAKPGSEMQTINQTLQNDPSDHSSQVSSKPVEPTPEKNMQLGNSDRSNVRTAEK